VGSIEYKLTDRCRRRLLRQFPPRYKNVKCDHITAEFGIPKPENLPALPKKLFVVGYATDGHGVECLVVQVNNIIKRRPSGKVYHITLSIADGRKSMESNQVLAKVKWRRLKRKVRLQATVYYER
jgi:hypothetical protein